MSAIPPRSAQDWRETEKIRLKVSPLQRLWDHLLSPLRITVLSEETSHKWGLSSLKDERIRAIFPYCRGRLLDIGCGRNNLVATYAPNEGVGVDIYDWKCGAIILEDTSKLPFDGKSFETVTFLACLNHIPNREAVLAEASRVLADDGQILITMPTPLISKLAHKWWELLKLGEDWVRDWHEDEVFGFNRHQMEALLAGAGLELAMHRRFLYGFNHLYVARKRDRATQ
jgi:SAM-dependent methyltransferase